MNKQFRRLAACILLTGLCCSAALCTGCGTKQSSNGSVGQSVYIPEVPESIISEDEPGESFDTDLGTVLNFEDKLDIKLDQIIELDDIDKTQYRVIIAEMTITNKTTSKIDCSTLTHFSAIIDGTNKKESVYDVQAAVPARKYYTKINSPLQSFNQEIQPGETVQGYVELLAPPAWSELKLVYTPYKYYSNDSVEINLDESKFTHYTEKLS